jgi:ectoine hydroxylase-related dioxygenase (phytanoyl-CoA dioxygenase family)
MNFKDLEDKGYLVIPNVLTNDDIASLIGTYEKVKNNSIPAEYKNMKEIGEIEHKIFMADAPNFLRTKCATWARSCEEHTNIKANYIPENMLFFDNILAGQLTWHQEHGSYFFTQTGYNHLLFWIPIIKPTPSQSGLMVIPHDRLLKRDSEFFNKYIYGKGANDFAELLDGITVVTCCDSNDVVTLDFNISELKEILSVDVGDLIIMRGDLIHASQENTGFRVAISMHILNTENILTKNKFFNDSDFKKKYIESNLSMYAPIIKLFEKQDSIVLKDLI